MIFKKILRDNYNKIKTFTKQMNYSTKKFNVFVTQPIPQQAIDILKSDEKINLNINTETPLKREKLIQSVVNCDALFCTLNEKIDKELLDAASDLKTVATCSVGYDHIDVIECTKRNIKVGYTPGVLTNATAELTIGLLLNTTRRISEAIQAAKEGLWQDWKIMWMCGQGLYGSNIGIFGCGRIGLAVANRLKNFEPNRIMYHNRNRNLDADKAGLFYVSLEELLNQSDFLICTCASTKETENIFNRNLFEKMKSSSVFINVSRGNVVNQDDLCYSLKNNQIRAAGLDVCTPEPLPLDHELFKLKNCFLTPHICSAETTTRVKMSTITATNIVNGLNNKELVHQIRLKI